MSFRSAILLQSCLSPSWGGLEMVSFEFARDFQARGLHLETLCLASSPLEERLRQQGLPYISLPAGQSFLARFFSLRRILHAKNPRTLICHHLHDLWYLGPLVFFRPRRLVGFSHTFLGVSKKDPLHSWLYRRLDKLICLTEPHRENLQTHLNIAPEKLEIIPNMVDTERFSPARASKKLREAYSIAPDTCLIGVVGRLDEHKGQREAILAMEGLQKYGARLHLVLIGEDTLNNPGTGEKLRALVRERGLENRIDFTGFLDPVEEAMASLDILLVPSSAETFGRTIIEGMACGLPVIATRAGGVPDIIQDGKTGLLVNPQDSQDLARAIEKLLLEPEERRRIGQRARERAQEVYSRRLIEERLESLFVAD